MWILRNLTEGHGGGERGKKLQRGREANHKRLLNTENKLRVDGGWQRGKWVMGIEEGTCWGEHCVLCGSNEPWESTPKPRAHCMLANMRMVFF